jgi:hypothetical protein
MQQPTQIEPGPAVQRVDETIVQPASLSQRILSQEEQVSRFDRWVEFLSAVVLALATVATAWCAYQSTLWGGDETKYRAAANSATIKASQFSNAALQQASLHANLFVQWAVAYSEENELLTDFLYQRFPPALRTAMDAWIATEPLQNPQAPSSPFVMPEYQLPESDEAVRWEAEAGAMLAQAETADQTSDHYVLLTVVFASVLFFAGIAGKFQSQLIDLTMLILGLIVLLAGLVIAFTFPIQVG